MTASHPLGYQSNLNVQYYSLIIKTFSSSSLHFTAVHADLIEQTTSSIELVVLKRRIIVVIRKDEFRFQMFVTTLIGATSTNFVVKRDPQNFGSTCGSLRKLFWRHAMKNTQHNLKGWTPRDAPSELVQLWYQILVFPRDPC